MNTKIAPFWKNNPGLWFIQLEAQFNIAKISKDDAKYDYLVGNIESEILAQVSDIVASPPNTDKYSILKMRILQIFQATEAQRIKCLTSTLILGDKRPSQLLREMKEIAEDLFTENVLKTLWLQKLPTAMQSILMVSNSNLDDLAVIADQIKSINSYENESVSSTNISTEIHKMEEKINNIAIQIEAFQKNSRPVTPPFSHNYQYKSPFPTHKQGWVNNTTRFPNNQHPFQRQPNITYPSHSTTNNSYCWYHNTFGRKARQCTPPCSFNIQSKN